jgi:hypothetical protein
MSESPKAVKEEPREDRPTDMARRAVLRHGAKLVYVVPAVLVALRATPAHAVVSGAIGVLKRRMTEVPADILAFIDAIEREALAA